MAELRVTPEELQQQGNTLKQYGEDLENTVNQIDALIKEIDSGWDGLAQTSYTDTYEELKKTLDQVYDCVQNLGEATTKAGEAYLQADQEIANAFSK